MDVLIAHGGEASRRGPARALRPLGLRITEAADGADALEALLAEEVPRIALVDWDLPRIEGPELCRLVRDFHVVDPPYVILLAGGAHGGALSAEPFSHDGHELEVTVTLGGVTGSEESAGELIARAQRSLDVAQAGGPDRVVAGRPPVLEAMLVQE